MPNSPEFDMHARENKNRELKKQRSQVPTKGTRKFMVFMPRIETLQNMLADEMLQYAREKDTHIIKPFFTLK